MADADSSDEIADPDGSDEEDTDAEEAAVDGLVTEESDTHTGSLNEEMWETDIVGNGGHRHT